MLQSRPMSIDQIVKELQAERSRLDAAIKTLTALSGSKGTKPKHHMSLAGRRKIAAAQRARWAKVKARKK